jgi:hypothetical protein
MLIGLTTKEPTVTKSITDVEIKAARSLCKTDNEPERLRSFFPRLLDEVERLRGEVDQLRGLISHDTAWRSKWEDELGSEIDHMRPVYEAAKAWRGVMRGAHAMDVPGRNSPILGPHRGLIAAVDDALAAEAHELVATTR